jgi:predicted unusual protein kinase regulating ubiquinone biosynthesis (AarF/ABC1/UbiB family)
MSTDDARQLGERFLDAEKAISTSVLGRVARTARSAVGLGRTLLSRGDPDLAAVVRLTTQLGELKGVAMKMGQVLGFLDPTLPSEVRQLLALLQTRAPASPWESVEATLRGALGDRAEALLAGLDRRPVAVASIGQVHHGRLPDGTEVAVKVRHPGIDAALRADFAAARSGVSLANTVLLGAAAGARDAVEEARSALLAECDFAAEADHQERFARLFSGDPVLEVPGVERAFCAESVLTTRWRPGRSLDQLLAQGPPQAERDRIGEALFRFYIGALYRTGWFHADPHPGNYAFSEDGRVLVYDFGCVRHFAAETVAALADLVYALRAGDIPSVCDAAGRLGFRTRLEGEDLDTFLRFARSFFAPLLEPGRHAITPDSSFEAGRMVRDKRLLARLGMPGHLLFLLRIRFGLYAVLARLGAAVDWGVLESAWAASVRERSGF